MPGSCAYASEYTAEIQRLANNGVLKRKKQFDELKHKYGNRHFWARGYYADTVGRNKKRIQECIKHRPDEDRLADRTSSKEHIDPFTGNENEKAKKRIPLRGFVCIVHFQGGSSLRLSRRF